MGEMVIAAYRPKPGHEADLEALVRGHVPFLRRLGLATERPALAMRAKDGVIVEVFEWGEGMVDVAHQNAEVRRMWDRFAAACDYVSLDQLAEAKQVFPGFRPLDL